MVVSSSTTRAKPVKTGGGSEVTTACRSLEALSIGRIKVKVEPEPGFEEIVIEPPMSSISDSLLLAVGLILHVDVALMQIVGLFVKRLAERLLDRDLTIEVSEAAKAKLIELGWDPTLGARPLRRAVQHEIEDRLSEKILHSELDAGDHIRVDFDPALGKAYRRAVEWRTAFTGWNDVD